MLRRTQLAVASTFILLQLTGCCWHRPLFNRGCYPFCNSGVAAAPAPVGPVLAPAAPVFSGGYSPIAGPDCVGCGGGGIPLSSAPMIKSAPIAMAPTSGVLPSGYPIASFKPEQMGLPAYPVGQPMPGSFNAVPPGSTPLPAPNITKDDGKKN